MSEGTRSDTTLSGKKFFTILAGIRFSIREKAGFLNVYPSFREMKRLLGVLAVLILTLSCANSAQEEPEQILPQDIAAIQNQQLLDIPVGVGLLTNYGFDVDRPDEGWPSSDRLKRS